MFCVSDFDEPSTGDNVGRDSGTYSTINMGGHELDIGNDGQIVIALSADAAQSLTMGSGDISLTLVTGLSSTTGLNLDALASKTSFELTDELPTARSAANPAALIQNVSYALSGGNLVLRATYGAGDSVPEPSTGTLSLLALAGLCARRRRK